MYIIPKTEIKSFVCALVGRPKNRYASTFMSRTLTSLDDLKQGIYNVYESGVPFRTGKQIYKVGNYRIILDDIAEKVFNYFNNTPNVLNTQSNFDIFHHSLCVYFLSNINAQRTALHLVGFTYGNAQKLINMYFKYLVCYRDYDTYAALFEYCHMPIDKFVLNGLRNIGVSDIGGNIKTSMNYCGIPWTGFDYSTYISLVNEYRKLLHANLSALYYDFCIWGKPAIIFPTSGILAVGIKKFFI